MVYAIIILNMRNIKYKYYYTYKVILLKGSLSGHYYYGQHKTNDLCDGYAGSGRILKDYYKKYSKIEGVTYVKSILQFYNNSKELNVAEKNLIGTKYQDDEMCLNLVAGGNSPGFSDQTLKKMSKSLKGRTFSENTKVIWQKQRKGIGNGMYGKKHTASAKKKISDYRKTCIGKNSSRAKKVVQFSLDGKFIKIWDCMQDAANTLGLANMSHISECAKGNRNQCAGFRWKFVEDHMSK